MAKRICSIVGCEKHVVGRGWCSKHWYRWRTHGDPLGGRTGQAVLKALDHLDGTRSCSQCGSRKTLDEFDKVKNATLGRRSNCKACRSVQMKARYAADRDNLLAGEQARRKARLAAKVAANPEHYARLKAERAWRAESQARIDSVGYRRKRRMSERRRDLGVTRANLRAQYGDACFYCDVEMSFTPLAKTDPRPKNLATVEHVTPIARGGTHTWDNTVLACHACNCSKNATPLEFWSQRQSLPAA